MGGFGSGRRKRPDRTAGGHRESLVLHEKQREFIALRRMKEVQYLLFGGGVRGGKSKCLAADCFIAAVHDYPGDTFVICRRDLKDLKPQLWRDIVTLVKRYIPKERIVKNATDTCELHIEVDKDGETVVSRIMGFGTKDPSDIMGLEVRAFYLDEAHEIPKEFLELMASRFSHKEGEDPYHWYAMACNPHPGWIKDDFISEPDENHVFIPCHVQDNPFIDREGTIAQQERAYGANLAEKHRLLYGDWFVAQKSIYPMWVDCPGSPRSHVVEFDLAEDVGYKHLQSMDWGFANPTAILFLAQDHMDNVWVYDEIYRARMTPQDTWDEYEDKCVKWGLTKSSMRVIADPQMKAAGKELGEKGSGFWGELIKLGMRLTPANKKRGPGTVQEMLSKGTLFVHPRCVNLRKEFPEYKDKTQSFVQSIKVNAPEGPEKKDDHALDALRYGINHLNGTTLPPPPPIHRDTPELLVKNTLEIVEEIARKKKIKEAGLIGRETQSWHRGSGL